MSVFSIERVFSLFKFESLKNTTDDYVASGGYVSRGAHHPALKKELSTSLEWCTLLDMMNILALKMNPCFVFFFFQFWIVSKNEQKCTQRGPCTGAQIKDTSIGNLYNTFVVLLCRSLTL